MEKKVVLLYVPFKRPPFLPSDFWTKDKDHHLENLVNKQVDWAFIASSVGTTTQQCQERWDQIHPRKNYFPQGKKK